MSARSFISGLVAAAIFTACAPAAVVQDARLNADLVTDVLRATERNRNLAQRKRLPVELVKKDFVRRQFRSEAEGFVKPKTMIAYELLLKKLHLLPNDIDIETYGLDMLGKWAAGYYDARSGTMRIIHRKPSDSTIIAVAERVLGRDLDGEFLLAHEFAHALADQHFDLANYYLSVTTNADALIARQAAAEGDAQLVGLAFATGKQLKRVAFVEPRANYLLDTIKALLDIPPAFRRPLLFLYLDGLVFAQCVYERGGTQGLNRLYTQPPRSSEEVLHPDKYFRRDDPPIEVRFESDPTEMRGLDLVDENTLGELGILALLGSSRAAAGWGGDRYRLYRYPNREGGVAFAWRSVWDSPRDRDEFLEGLADAFTETFGVEGTRAPSGALLWHVPEGRFSIEPQGEKGAFMSLVDA